MPLPRRQFLRTTLGLGALLALRGTGRAAETVAPGTPAPRGLLFDAADLPRIRANLQRPEFKEFWAYLTGLDFAAEEKFLNQEINFKNHVTDMSRAQVTMMRAAFMHLLYPDPKQLALARLAMSRVMGYPHWDWLQDNKKQPVSIMRGAGTCIGLAMVSEWLAADLTPAEQEAISNGMAVEGGPSCYRGLHDMTHHDEVGEWSIYPDEEGLPPISVARWPHILDETNLRITCTAGMVAAAAHLQGRHPDAPKWLEATRASLRRYSAMLPKDGSFPEGVGYWDYTFTHYIFTLEVLRRKFGVDDRALIDFPAEAQFALEMTLPTATDPDGCISIGDSGSAAGSVPLSWIAREYRDTTAQEMLLRPGGIRPAWTGAWTAIWYDPSVPAKLSASARLDRLQALGIVISRTGWTAQDTVVTLRSGGPVNHEHADRNSVIFAAHGERLFNDPVHASYSTKDPKWLLRQTEAHTAVLINGRGHIYHDGHDGTNKSTAVATIQDYRTGLNWMTVTSNATDAYHRAGLPASLVQRTLVYLKPGVLVIFDRVLLTEPLPVQARFQVFNDDGAGRVTAADRAFTIARPQATLHAWVVTAGESTVATGKLALPEAGGVYPFAEIQSAPAREHMLLTVCSTAPQGEAHGELSVTHDAGTWRVTGTHRGQTVKVAISRRGSAAAAGHHALGGAVRDIRAVHRKPVGAARNFRWASGMRTLLRGVVFLASLFAVRAENPPPAPPADPFEGTWVGTVSAPNAQTEIAFTFTPGKKGLDASVTMPAMFIHGMDLGPAQIADGTYTLPDLGIKLTLADGRLTGTFANPLLRAELHRGPVPADAAPTPELPPAPAPAWTHSLGAETWASPVARDGLVYAGSVDGKFHAVRAADGSEAWTWAGPHPLYGEALATTDSLYFLDESIELVSLRRSDGQLQWRVPLYDEKLAGKPARKNPTFNRRTPVPVLADGTLYLGSPDHGLYALDAATGKILWRHDLGASVYGAIAIDDSALVAGCADGSVVVLDRLTGAESARTKLGGPIASAPVIAGDMILAGNRDYLLYGLRRSDLGIAWRDTYWFSWVESVPALVDGLAYIGGSDFRRISAIDPATGQARWATDVRGITWGTPVVTGDTVFAGTSAQNPAAIHHEGGIIALDRRTGAVKWRHFIPLPASGERAGYIGSLVLADGKIIGAAFDGTLTAYPVK